MGNNRRKYNKEFKDEAVRLYKASGKTMAAIERELGLSKGMLKQWVRAEEHDGAAEQRLRQADGRAAAALEQRMRDYGGML